jgi:hypothetical protein
MGRERVDGATADECSRRAALRELVPEYRPEGAQDATAA